MSKRRCKGTKSPYASTPPGMLETHPRQYLVSRRRNVLYPPKFVKIVIKLPPELMRTMKPPFTVQQDTQAVRERERVIVLLLHELWRHPLHTFRLCLHVGINARWVSVTYFLLGQLVPPMFDNHWRRCKSPSYQELRWMKKWLRPGHRLASLLLSV